MIFFKCNKPGHTSDKCYYVIVLENKCMSRKLMLLELIAKRTGIQIITKKRILNVIKITLVDPKKQTERIETNRARARVVGSCRTAGRLVRPLKLAYATTSKCVASVIYAIEICEMKNSFCTKVTLNDKTCQNYLLIYLVGCYQDSVGDDQ